MLAVLRVVTRSLHLASTVHRARSLPQRAGFWTAASETKSSRLDESADTLIGPEGRYATTGRLLSSTDRNGGRTGDDRRRGPSLVVGRILLGRRIAAVSQDINVLALVKGNERYVFLFDDAHRSDALRTLGRFASNPDLSFTWYDAAMMSRKVREVTSGEPAYTNRIIMPLSSGDERE